MGLGTLTLLLAALAAASGALSDTGSSRPRLDLVSPSDGYHGLVREDQRLVDVSPPIRAVGAAVCGFRIVNKHHGDVPFEVVSTDASTGEAVIQARRPLSCEKRKSYRFEIAAVGCDPGPQVSDNVTVHIEVEDVNEFAPRFTERSYILDVDEGRLYDEIVQVAAEDDDCSPKYGDICRYEILSSDQPFVINSQGTIRNTEPLSYEKSHNHILFIVAYDCGMKMSDKVTVTIKVNRVCHLGWKDLPEHVEYAPNSGAVALFPDATLDMCEVPCAVDRVQSKISLQTSHIGKGCDRDTFSVENQRRLCGADARAVDLLPSPTAESQWTRPLPRDHGHESDEVFQFDGTSTAVVVPPSVMEPQLGNTFTISVWLRHADHPGQDKHVKEHVLCNADDHRMNRHHYALFIRNCHLIMLLRREYDEANLNTFSPAEWRWQIPQVCDDEWHHYSLSMQYPDLTLTVDGRPVSVEPQMHEVIDDWPLHSAPDLSTRLAVGGCWQGSESRMKHIFNGYMAGLSVLRGATEKAEVLSCLHSCSESLQAPDVQFLLPGMELLANNDMTEVTVEGSNRTHIQSLFRKIAYVNSREFPTAGRRGLKVITNLVCTNGKMVKIPVVDSYVIVRQPRYLHIAVNGTDNFSDDYEQLKTGVSVFPDIRVLAGTDQQEMSAGRSVGHKLDKCAVTVYPPLNPEHEELTLNQRLLDSFQLRAKLNKDGLVVYGPGQPDSYQEALRFVQYTNRKPAYYLNRAFKLLCSSMSQRFISNEYVQTLTVIHPARRTEPPKRLATAAPPAAQDQEPAAAAAAPAQPEVEEAVPPPAAHVQDARHHVQLKSWTTGHQMRSAGASHAVTIIIVVCIGFLVSMIVLGVIRIRAAHRRHQDEAADAEMAWDDSALNITVNPMEEDAATAGQPAAVDDDSSDDGSDYDSSDPDDDEEEVPPPRKQLEWDNSHLAI
ncbi:calsyntenin-1-like [Amphibalanus amphitrite]|uniref:calsyntenin-1-like n=1 Tax=Amphibalanus amphitrite TaxID=1232801 RepID=UPI001C90CF91|nr:calsyntenin-1-like [Amphibalanus amphitrite]